MSEISAESVVEAPTEAPAEALSIEDRISAILEPQEEVPREEAAPESDEALSAEPEEQPEADSTEIGSLSELADHLEVEAADLYNLGVSVNQDGQPVSVSLGELKDSWQAQQSLSRQAEEAKAAREAFEAEAVQARQHIEANIAMAAQVNDHMRQALLHEYQSLDWDGLREADPAGWAAKRQEFAEKQAFLEQSAQQVQVTAQQHQQNINAQIEQEKAKTLEVERAALLAAIPDWQDEAKAKAGMAEVSAYLKQQGLSDSEIDGLADHRAVVLARKAMLYDRDVKTADAEKKRVVRIGKRRLKPGAQPDAGEMQRERRRNDMQKFVKGGGNVDDAAALLESMGI